MTAVSVEKTEIMTSKKNDDHVSEIQMPCFTPADYRVWKNEINLWANKSNIDKEKLAPTIFFL